MQQSRLAERLGLKYPILQAPIGSMAGTKLAAAVSKAGGLGSLALTWTPAETAIEQIREVQAQTANPFFVNYVLAFPPASLDAALENGVEVVTFSWGQPGELIQRCHEAGALVGVQVGTADGARFARDTGADFVICQGAEAGGHVQSTSPLMSLLREVLPACPDLPIVAAGGLADVRDLEKTLSAGADAVMLGTRFVAVAESRAHPLYKQVLVESGPDDTVLTACFNGGWPNAVHRVLRNSTLAAWEDAGCPPVGFRPGESEQIAYSPAGRMVTRYDDTPPAYDMEGDVLACCLYAGLGCGKIKSIPVAADLLADLWTEYVR